MKFANKVCVVTGAGSGIGEAVAKELAQQGAKVVVSDIQESSGQRVVQEIKAQGHDVIFVKADVSSEADVIGLVESTVKAFGQLDVFVANAGINMEADVHELELASWNKVVVINLTGVFLCNKHAIAQMLKQGRGGAVVNMGSIHSFVARPGLTSYSASKGGVDMLTKVTGATYAKDGIRVNMVCPAYINTPLLNAVSPEFRDDLVNQHPIGRLGEPHEVAKAVAFLASDDASFISGTHLLVDGGYTAV